MDEEQGGGNAPLEPRLRTYRAPENGFLQGRNVARIWERIAVVVA